MKFDCGLDWPDKKEYLEGWHTWFAWMPVRLASHDCRWLERIERKGSWLYCPGMGGWWTWEYRSKE